MAKTYLEYISNGNKNGVVILSSRSYGRESWVWKLYTTGHTVVVKNQDLGGLVCFLFCFVFDDSCKSNLLK